MVGNVVLGPSDIVYYIQCQCGLDRLDTYRRYIRLLICSSTGRIARRPLSDVSFSCTPETGPFATVKDFHDWFSSLHLRPFPDVKFDDPFHRGLPDDVPIRFTHGDLHPSNIIVSSPSDDGEGEGAGPPHIRALVDFHQSGWLPAYWGTAKRF